MMPLISADNIPAMGMVMFGLACLGFWVDTNALGRAVAGAVWVILGASLLSNTGVIGLSSPVYDFVGHSLVPLAIPLLLFKADLRRIFRESGNILILFLVASFATLLGALIGYFMIDLGPEGAKIAGSYAAAWIGGAMNLVAVAEAVDLSKETFAVAISASSPVSVLALLALLTVPTLPWIQRVLPSAINETAMSLKSENTDTPGRQDDQVHARFRVEHICGAVALSFLICALSRWIAEVLGIPQYSILIITILVVVIVNLKPAFFEAIEGPFETGMILMYLFFAVIGASTDVTVFLDSALHLLFYGAFILGFNIVFMLGVAKVFKLDLAEVIVASGAAIVGPAATAAVATTRGWKELVTPAIMCGVLGYVIANFIGVFLAQTLG